METETSSPSVKVKKIDFVFDVNKHLQDQLKNSKYIKWTFGIVGTVGALFALGYIFKVLNFTVHNYKNLAVTMRR